MTDSLVLQAPTGSYELNNGRPYWIDTGFDFGAAQPDTVTLSRLLVDGEVLTGDRSSNRTLAIPVVITSSTRLAGTAAVQALAQAANQSAFTLTWTPTGGLPVVFDCFRGQVEQQWDIKEANQGIVRATIHCQALPFTRPPAATTLILGAAAEVSLDSFETLTGLTGNGTQALSTNRVQGSNSVAETVPYTLITSDPATPGVVGSDGVTRYPMQFTFSFARALAAATDLTTHQHLLVNWLYRTSSDGSTYRLTLYSASGSATYGSRGVDGAYNEWAQVRFDLTSGGVVTGTFDLSAVTSYQLVLTNGRENYSDQTGTVTSQVDDLRARSSLTGSIISPVSVLRVDGVTGVARTPTTITVSADQPVTRLVVARSANPRTGFNPAPALDVSGTTYTIPAGTLDGTYTLLFRADLTLASSGPFTVVATATMTNGATQTISRTYTVAGGDLHVSDGSAHPNMYVLENLTLPPAQVPGSNYNAPVTISLTTDGAAVGFPIYLLDTAGDAFYVNLPSPMTGYKYFQITPPDATGFHSEVYAGNQADGSDWISISQYVVGQGAFNLEPGSSNLLVILDNDSQSVTSGALKATFFPRYFAGAAS